MGYAKLLNDDDKKAGGITLARYQELYAQFIGNPDESNPAVNLFGPLSEIAQEACQNLKFFAAAKILPKKFTRKILSVEDDMILPTFAVFSIYYINYHHQKLDQKLLHFFLPSANFMINLNFIERMMQSAGGQTLSI